MFGRKRSRATVLEAGTVGVTGKAPAHAEFLHPPTAREPLASFDAWLEGAMAPGEHESGLAWTHAFDVGEPCAFVWTSAGCDVALVGVLAPSRDLVGRRHPVAAFGAVECRALGSAPYTAPLAFGAFFEDAYGVVQGARSGEPVALVHQRAAGLVVPRSETLSETAADYRAWCAATPLAAAWAPMYPARSPGDAGLSAVAMLSDVAPGTRAGVMADAVRVVRAPLGTGGPAAAVFWLDLIGRFARQGATLLPAVWGVHGGPLHAFLGEPRGGDLRRLWLWSDRGDGARDLTVAAPFDGGADHQAPPAMMRLFSTPDATVRDLLAALES